MRETGEIQQDSQVQRHSAQDSVRRPSPTFSATPRAASRSRHGMFRLLTLAPELTFAQGGRGRLYARDARYSPNLPLFPGRTSAPESRRLLGLMADPGLEVLARGAR